MISVEFVLDIRAEEQRRAQEELRDSRARRAKRCAAFSFHINRGRSRHGLEIPQLQVHGRKTFVRSRTAVKPPEIRFLTQTTTRNHGPARLPPHTITPRLPHPPPPQY